MKEDSKKPRICLSDSSLNKYGYRVLTSGLDIEAFKANPVMLYMHYHDRGSEYYGGTNKAIGHWEDIQVKDDILSAVPVFDCTDELSAQIAAKFEAGTYNAASIGFKIIETSEDPKLMLPGQKRATVTKAQLVEASIVDIPANDNAVRLLNYSAMAQLAACGNGGEMPALITNEKTENIMNFKDSWKTITRFLGIGEDKATDTTLSADMLDKVDGELARLQAENEQKNGDVEKLTAQLNEQKAKMDEQKAQIAQLTSQVEALKAQPAEQPADPTPANEPVSEPDADELAAFCNSDASNAAAIVERLRKDGLIK